METANREEPDVDEEVTGLLILLRKETRQDHHDLDHHPVLQRLLEPGLDRDGYAGVLQAMYRPQHFMEASIKAGYQHLGLDGQALPASRTGDLERDLAALGYVAPDTDGDVLLSAESKSVLMGQRYVLEGARKGSVFIAGKLCETLGPGVPMRYFQAADPEPNWQQFVRQLATLLPALDPQAAVRGARSMFHAYHRRLL
ncbi:MAG: biliverdin-producing heme oxygenase [Pseudohongiellaceae bacterium]